LLETRARLSLANPVEPLPQRDRVDQVREPPQVERPSEALADSHPQTPQILLCVVVIANEQDSDGRLPRHELTDQPVQQLSVCARIHVNDDQANRLAQ
jgi:hypothetical protein